MMEPMIRGMRCLMAVLVEMLVRSFSWLHRGIVVHVYPVDEVVADRTTVMTGTSGARIPCCLAEDFALPSSQTGNNL